MNTLKTDPILSAFKRRRQRDTDILESKLSKVALWQKRLAKAKDPSIEGLVVSRLATLGEIMQAEGICLANGMYPSQLKAILTKGEVAMKDLEAYVEVDVNGRVVVRIFKPNSSQLVYRVSVGKKVVVTNNVLASLLNQAPKY